MSRNVSLAMLVMIGFAACWQTGCTTMTPFGNRNIPTETTLSPGSDKYQVVMMSPVAGMQTYTGEIEPDMTVQKALEKSGALKKFRSMSVDLYRMVPENKQTLKMACEFQPSKRILRYEQDYALRPGDRIMVTAEPNALERMLQPKSDK